MYAHLRHATPRHGPPPHAARHAHASRHATPRATPRHATPRHATPRHATRGHNKPTRPRHATPRPPRCFRNNFACVRRVLCTPRVRRVLCTPRVSRSRAAREPLESRSRAAREPLRSRRLPRRAKPSQGAAAKRRSDRAATLCLVAARRVLRRAACSRARVLTTAAPFVCYPTHPQREHTT